MENRFFGPGTFFCNLLFAQTMTAFRLKFLKFFPLVFIFPILYFSKNWWANSLKPCALQTQIALILWVFFPDAYCNQKTMKL